MNNDTFIMNYDGKEIECTIIDTFYSTEFHRGYVLYTDGTLDEEGKENLFASWYELDTPDNLMSIETDEEWQMINAVLQEEE